MGLADNPLWHMSSCGRYVDVFSAGVVVNPAHPWLGASPDGKVLDRTGGYGLLEVKCQYQYRNIRVQLVTTSPFIVL